MMGALDYILKVVSSRDPMHYNCADPQFMVMHIEEHEFVVEAFDGTGMSDLVKFYRKNKRLPFVLRDEYERD